MKIKFSDSFGIKVKGFGKDLHSIPIIQDGVSHANIALKTKKKTFFDNAKCYAYLAVLKNDGNKNVLTSDVGWLKDDVHKNKAIIEASIKTGTSDSADFYIPTSLEWELGT